MKDEGWLHIARTHECMRTRHFLGLFGSVFYFRGSHTISISLPRTTMRERVGHFYLSQGRESASRSDARSSNDCRVFSTEAGPAWCAGVRQVELQNRQHRRTGMRGGWYGGV